MWRWAGWPLAALVVGGALVAACGGDSGDKASGVTALTAATVDCGGLGVKPPARIATAGKVVVATALSYAPIDFTAEGSGAPIGLDVDIAKCVAKAWGVTVEFNDMKFDQVMPALLDGKADIIMAAMSDTEERRQQADFVDYFNAGSGFLVKQGNPKKVQSMTDLCGTRVGIQSATLQVAQTAAQSKSCGDRPITIIEYSKNAASIDALAGGKIDVALMDYPVAIYTTTRMDGVEVAGSQFDTGPYGIAVRKDDGTVKSALDAVVAAMRTKGQYDAILKYWGLGAGKVH
jgi:polar amino acid transport system substrate-binding protein